MSTTSYKKYVEDTLILTRSLIIKSEATALAMNEYIKLLGYVINDDKTTWKYYLNLAGIPHFLDKTIYVNSFDTKETIEFSIESLKIHPVTKQRYQPHTQSFKQLVKDYPEQELLIRGILNPTDLESSINALDYTLLAWDTSLVEEQETNLINSLQDRIYKFGIRWHNPSYLVTDEVYLASHLGVMFLYIPSWLMSIRLNNAKTYYAHSFHIKEYLKSNGKYDIYFDYLNLKQLLFLYRNILYLQNNVGKKDTFNWLVEKLLTDRNIVISEYNVKLNLNTFDTDGQKSLEFSRETINLEPSKMVDKSFGFEETLSKERDLAVSNFELEEPTLKDKTYKLLNGKTEFYKTKLLESVAKDLTDAGPVSFTSELLKYWGYWSNIGTYFANFTFIEPSNGFEIDLTAREAFLMFIYSFNRSLGIELIDIPKGHFDFVRGSSNPTRDKLESVVPNNSVPDYIYEFALNRRIYNVNIPFNYTFTYTVSSIYEEFKQERIIYANVQEHKNRAYVENIFNSFYESHTLELSDEFDTFDEWFKHLELDFSDVEPIEFESFSRMILETVTGVEFYRKITMSGIQDAMISILKSLSSYHVQYAQEVNEFSIPYWDRLDIRLDKTDVKYKHDLGLPLMPKIVQDAKGLSRNGLFIDSNRPTLYLNRLSTTKEVVNLDTNVVVTTRYKRKDSIRLPISKTMIQGISDNLN